MASTEDNAIEEARALLGEYEQYLAGKAAGTVAAYLRTMRHLIGWIVQLPGNEGQFEPQQLTQPVVEQYLGHLEQEGLGLAHRARVRSTISNFAQYLIEEKGLLRRNPTRGIELPAIPMLPGSHLSPDQRELLRGLIGQAADERGAALFALGYWAGCRVSELSWLELTNTHVGPKEGWLRVGYDDKKWREIDLLTAARAPLYAYLQATRDIPRTYVFTSQRSERLTEQGIYYWFRMLKSQASEDQQAVLTEITFHDLRRDFAYRAREAGWSPEEMSYYLGGLPEQGPPVLQPTSHTAPASRAHLKHKLDHVKG
jgi:site-specific recombinase XerD